MLQGIGEIMMIPVSPHLLAAWEDHNPEITAYVSGDLIHEARTSAGLVNASRVLEKS